MPKLQKVITKVDGMIFESMVKAAKFLNCKAYELSNAFKADKTVLNGHTIERLTEVQRLKPENPKIITTSKGRARKVEVLCTNTNEKFESITALARKLGLRDWTIGLKMEKAGKFIDKDGNEYIRLTPMKRISNHALPNTSPELRFKSKNTNSFKSEVESIVENTSNKAEEIVMLENVASKLAERGKYSETIMVYELLNKLTTKE